MTTFIPSLITPGKHFTVGVYKPQGRPAYATTTEVDVHPDGSGFGYILHEARMHRVALAGNNTPKNRERAIAALMSDLIDRGWIDKADATAEYD